MNDESLKLDRQLCFKLYQASRKMTRLYQPLLESIGLTYPQYLTMLLMWEFGELDFKDLSMKLDLKTGTLTPIIQKLEKQGYLKRLGNPNDKRKVNVVLTEEGKELGSKARNVPGALASRLSLDYDLYKKYFDVLDEIGVKLNEAEAR
jgi:DNA-binding MarR family transcriptional regulator